MSNVWHTLQLKFEKSQCLGLKGAFRGSVFDRAESRPGARLRLELSKLENHVQMQHLHTSGNNCLLPSTSNLRVWMLEKDTGAA